jgi:hypothetical protein
MLVGTPMTTLLRELRLGGANLSEVPPFFRQLRSLAHLSLTCWFELKALPEWMAELPLETLDLVNTGVASLSMLHASTTLRCVIVFYTPLGLEWTEEGDDDDNMHMFTTESVGAVLRELGPLSGAQPQMRFLVLNEEGRPTLDDCSIPNWNGWWHRQAGIDLYSAQW